eukprot:324663-Karenia_brevis.AAC.1
MPVRIRLSFSDALRRLDEKAAPGISGFRNTYWKQLTGESADLRAAEVTELLDCFAEAYVNADLAAWFYVTFSSIRLVAPIKSA